MKSIIPWETISLANDEGKLAPAGLLAGVDGTITALINCLTFLTIVALLSLSSRDANIS